MRKKIECLIRSGKSTKEIQEIINDFPIIITTEYFQKLGFDKIESIKLKWLLKKNDRKEEEEEKAVEARRELLKESSYRFSANANPNFILMDTCALQFKKGIDLLEKSEKVVVIESILEEMEKVLKEKRKKKNKTVNDEFLIKHIKEYQKKIAKETKYNKVLDTGEKYKYVDNRILYFLYNLSEEDRPTLLTADVNLANRANCYGLEYILVTNTTITQEEKQIETKQGSVEKQQESVELETSKNIQIVKSSNEQEKITKTNILGVSFKLEEDKILIRKYNPNPDIYFVKDKQIQLIKKQDEMELAKFDYIILLLRLKHYREVRVVKLVVVNNKIEVEKERITFLNEIYQIEMPEEIQNETKELLLG